MPKFESKKSKSKTKKTKSLLIAFDFTTARPSANELADMLDFVQMGYTWRYTYHDGTSKFAVYKVIDEKHEAFIGNWSLISLARKAVLEAKSINETESE